MAFDHVRYNRARRAAWRQGLRLVASRRRDPRAIDFERFALVDQATGREVFGHGLEGRCNATLEEIEAYLKGERK